MVYPRVGGGTPSTGFLTPGLLGSIPAWAGEPGQTCSRWVYPRVGGGTGLLTKPVRYHLGSIPAWAGEPDAARNRSLSDPSGIHRGGSIPAWAGEPWNQMPEPRRSRSGLSPRGRGNPLRIRWTSVGSTGVYPRVGGGTAAAQVEDRRERRSIPAWAGEPRIRWTSVGSTWGLSPRGRGNRSSQVEDRRERRSIPAWAGEPDSSTTVRKTWWGSIPAWAGEPQVWSGDHHPGCLRVYPRVGGGTVDLDAVA